MDERIELIECKLIKDAENFRMAGNVLMNSKERCVENQMFLTQIIFLNRHACELFLKALLLKLLKENSIIDDIVKVKLKDINGKKLNKTIFETHSILILYDCLIGMSKFSIALSRDRLIRHRQKAIQIDNFDGDSTYFRYPIDKEGNLNYRTYFINFGEPDICPDFNDYPIDAIFVDEETGDVNINIVPEILEYNKKIIKFYNFLKKTQELF